MKAFFMKIISALAAVIMLILSPIINPTPTDKAELLQKADGFILGICHPNENYEQIAEANIGWVRFDIPYPYNSDGTLSDNYLAFKQRAKSYADRGFKVMAITPYPSDYIGHGLDPRKPECVKGIQDIAVFLCNDLRECVAGLQITNEMGVAVFTYPLTLEEAANFIGIQLEAVDEVKGDIIVGYNSAGSSWDFQKMMTDFAPLCDYVGIDIYLGCFGNDTEPLDEFKEKIIKVYRLHKRPIIVQEFGYISAGEPKTAQQRLEVLQSYGYSSEDEARADIENLVQRLPAAFINTINIESDSDKTRWADVLFGSLSKHFYRELGENARCENFPHTHEGQAEFLTSAIDYIYNLNCVAGIITYCYSDSPTCWQCGQEGCPFETAWGIVDCTGQPKPAYFAVKQAYAKILENESNEKESVRNYC